MPPSLQPVVYVGGRSNLTGQSVWVCTLACGHSATVRRDGGQPRKPWINASGQCTTAPKRLKCRQCPPSPPSPLKEPVT